MTQEVTSVVVPGDSYMGGSIVHSLLHFLWLLRRRKAVVIVCLTVCGMLGLLYYATAARIYRAEAQVVVRLSQPENSTVTLGADRSTQDQMATFQRLFTSAVVLSGGLDKMSQLPPEISPQDTRERAIDILRENVVATTIRGTSIIDVVCNSRDPAAAAHVVDAIVAAYIEYIDQNHQSVTAELSSLLNTGREELEVRLDDVESQMLAARKECADYGMEGNSGVVHPLIHNVIQINEKLTATRQRRVELQSSLTALRETVANGGDLRQHLVALEPLVGKELLMGAVGFSPNDEKAVQDAQRQLLEFQAQLRSLEAHLGPNHYRVVELTEKVKSTQQFIASFETRLAERSNGMHDRQLGSMLIRQLEEDLVRTWRHEEDLTREFALADAKAIQLSDRLTKVAELERKADWFRRQLETLMGKIENIDINQRNSDVRVAMVSPPVVPDHPIRPVLTRVLLMCLMLGTGLAAVAVYALDAIDDRFRSPEEIQDQLGVPVFAMVRRHEMSTGTGLDTLQVYRAPDAVESEAFRTLRTTLAFSGQDCNCIVVTSSEPSDGKTTVIANLAVSYAQAGKRTLLLDCDLRKPGLTKLFGLRRDQGVSEVLRSDEEIVSACRQRLAKTGMDNLDVMSAGRRPADSAELLSRARFNELVAWAESEYDQVLIDSPPILAAADSAIASRETDGLILVVQPQKNHRRLVKRALEGLHALDANVLGIVVNAVDNEDGAGYYGYGGYGYGYGYGGGYGNGYGMEAEEDQVDEEPASTLSFENISEVAVNGGIELNQQSRAA